MDTVRHPVHMYIISLYVRLGYVEYLYNIIYCTRRTAHIKNTTRATRRRRVRNGHVHLLLLLLFIYYYIGVLSVYNNI